jgi:alkanesulfonate monooxygenase SsuD/methylene tetrahydromethanopterin reductase-like flavin-dependent oxidoreductase (luciferase family)
MSNALPLSDRIRFGVISGVGDRDGARRTVDTLASLGFEVIWTGDHVAFTGPINDPLLQLTFMSALRPELTYGTSIYLLALRHPVPVAKMVATADRLMGAGHFIFGIGVGGEFEREYEACGVPVRERGGRTNEAIALLKRLWTEDRIEHRGRYFSFGEIRMEPKPSTPGGPPIWVGGRSEAARRRAARLGDGWMPYVITPGRYAEGLEFIALEMERARRRVASFGTSIHLFCTLGPSFEQAWDVATEHLSKRYSMDFREPARRYSALGRPSDAAEKIAEYIRAGARDIGIDLACHPRERDAMLAQFAREVIPLLRK